MRRFIIIAGPQAAGKSTVISQINDQYQAMYPLSSAFGMGKIPCLFPLQESRQIVVHTNVLLGGTFMTEEQELEVVKCDLKRMDTILSQPHDNLVYLDECNIFTLAHANANGFSEVEKYWQEYIDRLVKLQAAVIFLDVHPEVSWERRHHKYQQRMVCFPEYEHAVVLGKYYEYIQKLGPALLSVYEKLGIPKRLIDASLSLKTVMQNVNRALAELIANSK